jgi:hypothetical protein
MFAHGANRWTNTAKLAEETGELSACVFRGKVDTGEVADVILCALADARLCGTDFDDVMTSIEEKLMKAINTAERSNGKQLSGVHRK